MIKAIINIMGLKPGETVLDPMMGSGTVLIEASVMGIKSIGLDASPFCRFMTQTKIDALTVPLNPIKAALNKYRSVFEHLSAELGQPEPGGKMRSLLFSKSGNILNEPDAVYSIDQAFMESIGPMNAAVRNFLMLAYLDSAGYAERSKRKSALERFRGILERYTFVVQKIQTVSDAISLEFASAVPLEADARAMPLPDDSVDGVLFSPPYSFAIDYLKNDSFHLDCMGIDISYLRERMVGLRGKTLREKYDLYVQDMDRVLAECARVLRKDRFCTLIIGTNDNQLSKALKMPKESVKGLHQLMVDLAAGHGFSLVRMLLRQISGIANTMRNEYIVLLQRI
jgi:hypothetical protein